MTNFADCDDNLLLYQDKDKDGYGSSVKVACGGVTNNLDCDDKNALVGPCSVLPIFTEKRGLGEQSAPSLALSAYPNPSADAFTLHVSGNNAKEKVTLRVINSVGRVVEQQKDLIIGQNLQIGDQYRPGVYIVEAVQGGNRFMLKLVKTVN